MTKRSRVTFDFETRSRVDLKTAGAYKYSLDPSTRPTCLAFKFHGQPTVYFLDFFLVNRHWSELPQKLKSLWANAIKDGFEFSAHNAFFELCIYQNVLVARYGWPPIPRKQYRCTAAKAAACALPRNLEGAGEAMRLRVQKDKRGYVAMMATCRPTRAYGDFKRMVDDISARLKDGRPLTPKQKKWQADETKFAAPKEFLEPMRLDTIKKVLDEPLAYNDDAVKRAQIWDTLYTYCKIDVRSEEALDDALPDLIPQEQEIWFLNQLINWRGIRLDVPLIEKIVGIMKVEDEAKLKTLDKLTMGLVRKPGARKAILDFLALEGVELPDIRAKTIDDTLDGFALTEDAKRLLELRKALSKTSTKKFLTMLARANDDHRVRDVLLYHGASTGRDTGVGVQFQNLPRPLIPISKERPYAAVENIKELDAETLKLLYGDSLGILFSGVLRNMLIPSEGCELFVADFSKIEVAVLWWLSGNEAGLKVLRDGGDPYIYQAAANLGKTYEEIEKAVERDERWAGDARQLAKAQVLGCGFGMGWSKFQKTASDQYRLKLDDKQSREAVSNYREANAAVPEVWQAYEQAAIGAVEHPGRRFKAGMCVFRTLDGFLWVKLPSGRRLAYREPEVNWRMREFEKKEIVIDDKTGEEIEHVTTEMRGPYKTLEFMAVNSKTKKWSLERTWGGTLTENIVQATARDLMMPALVRLERAGYRVLLSVHDEGICEKEIGMGSVDEFVRIMCEPPPWATGLPLEAKGWTGPRYRKG